MAPDPESPITIRPYSAADQPFLARVARRLHPGQTASPRDPAVVDRFFTALAAGRLLTEPGAEAFVATAGGEPVGVMELHPDADYFTGHPRAYIDILVVAPEAEGRGIGRALLRHAEAWARRHGCREVVLDVFATNEPAVAFYERCGYRADHIRMAKPVD
jgi:ribosomal protein S18 acetylase RimI-like enzyme